MTQDTVRQTQYLREYLTPKDAHLTRAEGFWLLDELEASQAREAALLIRCQQLEEAARTFLQELANAAMEPEP